jgi:hypothetical protein
MLMKNRPSSTSWNGRMSVSTWCLYSVSEIAAGEQDAHQHRRLQRRDAQRHEHGLGLAAQGRDQHQQRHHGQVLEQQHAHHALAVLGLQLQPVGDQLDHDGRAAHGQRARQGQRRAPVHAPDRGHRAASTRLATVPIAMVSTTCISPARTRGLAHGAQLGQVELEPDDEHQEHHAELAEVAHAVGVLPKRQRVRPDEDADDEVAEHRRQLERPAGHHADHRGQQVHQRQFERGHGCGC